MIVCNKGLIKFWVWFWISGLDIWGLYFFIFIIIKLLVCV